MNIWDIIIVLLIVTAVAFAIRTIIKNKKDGKCCSCDCGSCGGCSQKKKG